MSHIYSQCVDCNRTFQPLELITITGDGWQHQEPCTPARRAEAADVKGAAA